MKLSKTHLLLAILLLLGLQLGAQSSIDNFTSIQSQGSMPADFKKITNSNKDFYDYNVFLKRMVMDGRILYGTPLNDYVNTIADTLLKDDLVLRSKIHIYIAKSPVVNAYATLNGIIIVNLGMIAQVSNESELAFILAHEIAHVAEKHALQYQDYKDTLSDKDYLNYYVKTQTRSRQQELEADKIALNRYFSKTNYSYEVMDGVFDVLQYSDLPFDEVPFPKSLVETDFYQFPSNYYLTNVAPINNRADMVDTLFTHPNIEKRRSAVHGYLVGRSNDGRSVFLQSEQLFNEMRELARFECINYFLSEHQFDHAFYNTYVLLQNHPNNKFLNEALTESVYGFAKYRNYGSTNNVITNYKKVEGEMQQTCHFLSKLNRQEAALLALRLAWKAKENDPNNTHLNDIVQDAMKDVFIKNKMKYQDFCDFPMGTNPDSIKIEDTTSTDAATNKYDRIKQQNKKTVVLPSEKFKTQNYMLVDLHQNDDFFAMMNAIINQAEDDKILDVVTKKEPVKIPRMLIATPQYVASNGKAILNKVSDKEAQKVSKNLSICLRKLKIDAVSYSAEDVCNFSTEQYNGYAELQQWMREYEQAEGMQMVYHSSKDMTAAYDLTGTTKVCQVAIKRTPGNFVSIDKTNALSLSAFCPYTFPFSVAIFAIPRYSTEMYLVVTDFQTGKTEIACHDSNISAMKDAYVNSFMYDQLYKFVKGK